MPSTLEDESEIADLASNAAAELSGVRMTDTAEVAT